MVDKKDTAEAKIIKALLDLCSDMAEELSELEADVEDIFDYCHTDLVGKEYKSYCLMLK